jgi:hypothetical protein
MTHHDALSYGGQCARAQLPSREKCVRCVMCVMVRHGRSDSSLAAALRRAAAARGRPMTGADRPARPVRHIRHLWQFALLETLAA